MPERLRIMPDPEIARELRVLAELYAPTDPTGSKRLLAYADLIESDVCPNDSASDSRPKGVK